MSITESTTSAETDETAEESAESPEVEVLVEEISIDGMCGVY